MRTEADLCSKNPASKAFQEKPMISDVFRALTKWPAPRRRHGGATEPALFMSSSFAPEFVLG
jgi:hypothetical protein